MWFRKLFFFVATFENDYQAIFSQNIVPRPAMSPLFGNLLEMKFLGLISDPLSQKFWG